jgi:MFS transporter, ACDE family, multidrug resistance protein
MMPARPESSAPALARDFSTWQLLPFYLGGMSGPMGGGVVPVLFAVLMGAFGVDRSVLSLAIPAYMLPYAAVQLISGGVSDLTSRRMSLVIGFGGFGLATVFAGLAPTFQLFLLAQVLQGATNAFTSPLLMATLGDVVPRERMSHTMGYLNTANLAGTMLAPLLGGFMGGMSWRLPFVVFGVSNWVLLIWIVLWFKRHGASVPNSARGTSLRADLREMAAALGLQMILLATLSFVASNAVRGAAYLFADYLSGQWGLSVASAGLILASYGLAGLIFGPFSGYVIEHLGVFRGVAISMIGVALSLGIMGIASSTLVFAAGNFLLGATSTVAWTGLSTLAVSLSSRHRGTASSLFGSARFLALAVCPLWFTPLYQSVAMPAIFFASAAFGVALLLPLAMLAARVSRVSAVSGQSP